MYFHYLICVFIVRIILLNLRSTLSSSLAKQTTVTVTFINAHKPQRTTPRVQRCSSETTIIVP